MLINYHYSFLIICLINFSFISFSQEKNYKIEAYYSMSFKPDSTVPEDVKQEEMILLIGEKESFFTATKYLLIDSAMTSELKKGNKYGPPMNFFQANGTRIKMAIFKNIDNVIYNDQAQPFTPTIYTYSEKRPLFNWQILNDTLNIAGLHCQKAVTTYGG